MYVVGNVEECYVKWFVGIWSGVCIESWVCYGSFIVDYWFEIG